MAEVIEDENHPARLARQRRLLFVTFCHTRAAVTDVTLERWMAVPFVAFLPVWTRFTHTVLPLFTYHNSMRHDGSQSEGTIVSAWQAAGETQLAVLWPCALTLRKLFSLLSCLFTLTMVLQAASLSYVMFLFPVSCPLCPVFYFCEGQFCLSIYVPKKCENCHLLLTLV